jgi:adenylate kinase
LFSPPKVEEVCDECGGELYQRDDDSLETAKDRLAVYYKETSPLIELYGKEGVLFEIDGEQDKMKTYPQLMEALS